MPVTPLFVPLARQWFEAFRVGEKRHEWRRYGRGWNETTCPIGRQVTLALGYTRTRLAGHIVSFEKRPAEGPAEAIYGVDTECAVIGIALD